MVLDPLTMVERAVLVRYCKRALEAGGSTARMEVPLETVLRLLDECNTLRTQAENEKLERNENYNALWSLLYPRRPDSWEYPGQIVNHLQVEVDRIRAFRIVVADLLESADCGWEERGEGHDWAAACRAARALMGRYRDFRPTEVTGQ